MTPLLSSFIPTRDIVFVGLHAIQKWLNCLGLLTSVFWDFGKKFNPQNNNLFGTTENFFFEALKLLVLSGGQEYNKSLPSKWLKCFSAVSPELQKGLQWRKVASRGDGTNAANVVCQAEGVPRVHFTWAKDGFLLDLGNPRCTALSTDTDTEYIRQYKRRSWFLGGGKCEK